MKKNLLKRIACMTLAIVLTVSSLVISMPASVYAAGGSQVPGVTQFATPDDLKDADNFTLYTGDGAKGVAQKVNFGSEKKHWYLAGADNNGTELVLMYDPEACFGTMPFLENTNYNEQTCISKNPYNNKEVFTNHYGVSDVRKYLVEEALAHFSHKEQELMINKEIYTLDTKNNEIYSTVDKLYLPYGYFVEEYITVGANTGDNLNGGITIGLTENGPENSPYAIAKEGFTYLLRAPYISLEDGDYILSVNNNRLVGVNSVLNCVNIIPAFNMDLSKVLFASSAEAAKANAGLTDAFTLRIINSDIFSSVAKIVGKEISVSYNNDDEDIYLYVQGKTDGTDWVKSVKVTESKDYSFEDLGLLAGTDLSKCKIWLEKTIEDDNLTYADYAREGHTVTINVNNDIMGSASATLNIAYQGDEISLSASAEAGYHFVKWESEDVTVSGDKFKMPSKDVNVTAVFKPHDCEWKSDADRHWQECKGCDYKSTPEKHIDANNDGKCDVCGYAMSTEIPIPKDRYVIKFDGNKATSGTMKEQTCVLNKSVTLTKNTFKRKGYTFDGWDTRKNGKGKDYKNKAKVKDLAKGGSSITLYAQWKPIKYTIKFNANGGKGTMAAIKNVSYDKSKALTKVKFTRKGYTFKGWATSKANAKKGKVAYKNKAKVKNLASTNGKTITLYAVWKKNK